MRELVVDVRRRRLVALRVCVCVLGVVAAAAWLANLQSRTASRSPPRAQLALLPRAVRVRGREGVPDAGIAKQRSRYCPLGTFFEPAYPTICSLGVPVTFVYLGGRALQPDYWVGAEQVQVLVLYKHVPLLPLPPLGEFPRLNWLLCEGSVYGTVPTEIGIVPVLWVVILWRSEITTLPSELGQLPLQELHVDDNPLLQGTIPSEIAAASTLTNLRLMNMALGGTIHSTFGLLSGLRNLRLDHIAITGTVPTQLGQLTNLDMLFCSGTSLFGSIPSQLGLLEHLRRLNGSETGLSGAIPSQLGKLSALTELLLFGSRFAGPIPSELGRLSSVQDMYLHRNELEGTIPTQLGLLNATALTLASNRLTGTVPAQLASMQRLTFLDVSHNQLSGSLPPFPDRVVVYCDASGLDDPWCPVPSPQFVDSMLVWAIVALAGVELLFVLLTGYQVFIHRGVSVIRATNPLFSVLTLASLALATAALFPFALTMMDTTRATRQRACDAMVHLGTHGVTLLPCCIAVRSYPLWRIFVNNAEMQQVTLTKAQLLRPVCANIVIATVLATLVGLGTRAERGVGCKINDGQWALHVLLAYTLTLCVSATFITFRIRNVPSKFNDTQNIAKATYLLLTFGAGMVCIGYVASDPTPRFLAWSFCVLLCVATFTGLVHVTKLLSLKRSKCGTTSPLA